jgi:hypothetical protein
MNAPDEDPAIATLLDEAAQLATVANAKLGEALAIAEQARRNAASMRTGGFSTTTRAALSGSARHGARGRGLAQ